MTTTAAAIRAHLVEQIEGLIPAAPPKPVSAFRYNRAPSRPLRSWLPDAGGNDMLRRFEIVIGPRADLGIIHTDERLVDVPMAVTIAYPADPNLYGLKERLDLEAIIEADATQILDEITSPSGVESDAHQANIEVDMGIEQLDRSDERFWYQDITFRAVFYAARRY